MIRQKSSARVFIPAFFNKYIKDTILGKDGQKVTFGTVSIDGDSLD